MRKLFSLLLVVFIGNLVFAQSNPTSEKNTKKKKMEEFLFFRAGFQMSTITGEDSWDSPLPSFVGAFGVILTGFGKGGTLRTALGYSMQGAKYGNTYGGDGKVVLGYLNLPITARFTTKSGFYGEAGLQPGFLLSAKDKFDGQSEDFKEFVNSFDMGIPIGIGYQFKNRIEVDARVTPGLLNLNKEGDSNAKNLTYGLNIGFTF